MERGRNIYLHAVDRATADGQGGVPMRSESLNMKRIVLANSRLTSHRLDIGKDQGVVTRLAIGR